MNSGSVQLVSDEVGFGSRGGVVDTRSGTRLSLPEALQQGVLNPARAVVKDTRSGRTMSLQVPI